ncbi:MAG: CHAD domain-containing protein, partial [Solirubrobacteraceae bacterium]
MTVRSDPTEGGRADSKPLDEDRAELVHEARKTIKRMRALARLLRYELGEQEFERVDGALRAAGGRL